MSTGQLRFRRLRTILDLTLIVLLVLLASASFLSAQAYSQMPAAVQQAPQAAPIAVSTLDPVNGQVTSPDAVLDDNTLAAMIAAENAALTLPIHFLDLPLIVR